MFIDISLWISLRNSDCCPEICLYCALLLQDDKRLHDYNVDEIVKQAIDDAVRQVSDWGKV